MGEGESQAGSGDGGWGSTNAVPMAVWLGRTGSPAATPDARVVDDRLSRLDRRHHITARSVSRACV